MAGSCPSGQEGAWLIEAMVRRGFGGGFAACCPPLIEAGKTSSGMPNLARSSGVWTRKDGLSAMMRSVASGPKRFMHLSSAIRSSTFLGCLSTPPAARCGPCRSSVPSSCAATLDSSVAEGTLVVGTSRCQRLLSEAKGRFVGDRRGPLRCAA